MLLVGCFGTIASLLIVGFARNFWMALFGRFLGGALNGNIGVIQTMVGELVTNPKHERKRSSSSTRDQCAKLIHCQREHTPSCLSCGP